MLRKKESALPQHAGARSRQGRISWRRFTYIAFAIVVMIIVAFNISLPASSGGREEPPAAQAVPDSSASSAATEALDASPLATKAVPRDNLFIKVFVYELPSRFNDDLFWKISRYPAYQELGECGPRGDASGHRGGEKPL
jgi:hypothetical protein